MDRISGIKPCTYNEADTENNGKRKKNDSKKTAKNPRSRVHTAGDRLVPERAHRFAEQTRTDGRVPPPPPGAESKGAPAAPSPPGAAWLRYLIPESGRGPSAVATAKGERIRGG